MIGNVSLTACVFPAKAVRYRGFRGVPAGYMAYQSAIGRYGACAARYRPRCPFVPTSA
ncbi:hypothetical protein C8Q77DRAFT_1150740 [Trametes polyzona]|nr:hypothetical protein C8Q77DRAFT_1150697 [Trametes polyzona]KAI0628123.1 hypothetical protein C8Q77DRAFT_1150740 [Trametes polyzona]